MKYTSVSRISFGFILFNIGIMSLSAQEINPEMVTKTEAQVNKWSFEFGFGSNIAVRPFGIGYNSSANFSSLNHFDFGFRYMLNSKFGIKSDIAFDGISNKLEEASFSYRSMQYRIGFQGVFNLGKVFEFQNFSNSIGLLGHAGFQFSKFKSKIGNGNQEAVVDSNKGFIMGITPQIKLSERIALIVDFSVLSNIGQNRNWDGSTSAQENNLTGMLYTTSIGMTIYLGKKDRHSDWANPKNVPEGDSVANLLSTENKELKISADKKEEVVDNLNTQNNTPSGLMGNKKENSIDTNNKRNLEELEPKTIEGNYDFKSLLENGLVNVFYDVNEDKPNSGSTNSVYSIISLLKKNPSVNIKLVGYSDKSGSEEANQKLSESRAKKLYELLVLSGISESRLKIIGYGEDSSIPSDSKITFRLARRVSVLLD
ncbi:OmpA family protein [Flavobacterium sp. LT1R49]|uniref:OmpA family protein n=1 Tax=Flavobacterium arabinosi TaxID=3398737 RepID=UPI003A8734F7